MMIPTQELDDLEEIFAEDLMCCGGDNPATWLVLPIPPKFYWGGKQRWLLCDTHKIRYEQLRPQDMKYLRFIKI